MYVNCCISIVSFIMNINCFVVDVSGNRKAESQTLSASIVTLHINR